MDHPETAAHKTGSTGPQVNGTAHIAEIDPEAVSVEQDNPEEDRPEYLRYVSYAQTHREEKFSFNSSFALEGRSYAITRSS
jgi:hypothetical protein